MFSMTYSVLNKMMHREYFIDKAIMEREQYNVSEYLEDWKTYFHNREIERDVL